MVDDDIYLVSTEEVEVGKAIGNYMGIAPIYMVKVMEPVVPENESNGSSVNLVVSVDVKGNPIDTIDTIDVFKTINEVVVA